MLEFTKSKENTKKKILCIQDSQNDTYHLITYIKIEFRGPNRKWFIKEYICLQK